MKIAIPSKDGKLCGHFGNCDDFTFVNINDETKEITDIKAIVPEGGVSCQCAGWIAEQGVNFVLAGGIGGRPYMIFQSQGVEVITGCEEKPIKELVTEFLNSTLKHGVNTCGGHEHHECHHH